MSAWACLDTIAVLAHTGAARRIVSSCTNSAVCNSSSSDRTNPHAFTHQVRGPMQLDSKGDVISSGRSAKLHVRHFAKVSSEGFVGNKEEAEFSGYEHRVGLRPRQMCLLRRMSVGRVSIYNCIKRRWSTKRNRFLARRLMAASLPLLSQFKVGRSPANLSRCTSHTGGIDLVCVGTSVVCPRRTWNHLLGRFREMKKAVIFHTQVCAMEDSSYTMSIEATRQGGMYNCQV